MNLPQHILVPVDFSPHSDMALDYAISLAKKLGAKVTVVHAYEIPVYGFPDGALVATADVADRILSGAQAALDAVMVRHKDAGIALTALLKNGDPREVVETVAKDMNADLIVMGTHGRRGISRALLGSVAEAMVRTSTRPVLTLHSPGKA